MDTTIRRNENCAIGLPRCDFVFSSTRTCFIAYGFKDSPMEKDLLRRLLKDRGIQVEEAGGALAPAQSAFCAKICSKIITSQFCIVLLNNEVQGDIEVPNANVNMEYGMMLGFNKYVIPFQKESQTLPFNVAGLDTVKYTDSTFEQQAVEAIDQAISDTAQDTSPAPDPDQVTTAFLLSKGSIIAPLSSEGEKNLFDIGRPVGFNLLHDFSGLKYMYFGNFTALRSETVLWRISTLIRIIDGRRKSLIIREETGITSPELTKMAEELFDNMEIWILVTSNDSKQTIVEASADYECKYRIKVFSMEDARSDLDNIMGKNV